MLRTIRSQGPRAAEFGLWLVMGRNGKDGGLDQVVNGLGYYAKKVGLSFLNRGEPSKVMRQSSIVLCFRNITKGPERRRMWGDSQETRGLGQCLL